MITVENLCFDYPGTRALDQLSFTLVPNSITALVGPNGAGKTTLLRCLAALETPMRGKIVVAGWDTDRHPRQVHAVCSYLSDFFGLYDELTVAQSLQFFAWSHRIAPQDTPAAVAQAAQRLHLTDYLAVPAGKLSRGLRQRLAIAQTIVHQPKILFLDEPSAGLDPQARHDLSQLLLTLQKEGMTLIVSSHILAELEDYCSHMLVLQKGQVVEQCVLQAARSQDQSCLLVLTLTEDAAPYLKTVQSLPSVKIKESTGTQITLDFQGDAQQQHALLKLLLTNNVPVCSIQEQKQRLQDRYLDLTKDLPRKE